MNYLYIKANEEAYNCANNDCVHYPGSLNKRGSNYPLYTVLSYTLHVSDASQVCGAVSEMKWTPDGRAVAMVWKLGGFGLWSVFGTLLHCTAASTGSGYVLHCIASVRIGQTVTIVNTMSLNCLKSHFPR